MLVLTREIGKSIIIDGNIKVTFLGNNSFKQGKIGIEAPKHIKVHREEIMKRIENEVAHEK